jgi:hypothetical protein
MASAGDYAVAQERDGAFRLDRITEPFSGTAALIKPVTDRLGHRIGWRLKPLVTMQGSLSKVWASPAEAIASTKLMTLGQAKIAVAKADPGPSFAGVGGAS